MGKKGKMKGIRVFCTFFIVLLFFTGCGRKTQPVPPGTIRPKAINDLKYRISQEGVELTWSVPIRNRDGTPIYYLASFQLFKSEAPVEEKCPGCPPRFGVPIKIPFDARPEEAKKMIYEDRTLKTGMFYTYEVRTVKGWLSISDPSNRVFFAWHIPPAPPHNVSASPIPEGLHVSWNAPVLWTDGARLDKSISYRVFRSRLGEDDWKDISGVIQVTGFDDVKLKKGLRFKYMVRAVFDYYKTMIQSEPSEWVEAYPKDTTPPSRPSGLVAISGKRGVELLWQENTEEDLSGYIVYRIDKRGLVDRINKEPVGVPRFLDRTNLPAGMYSYRITAMDRSFNESRPSKPVSVKIP